MQHVYATAVAGNFSLSVDGKATISSLHRATAGANSFKDTSCRGAKVGMDCSTPTLAGKSIYMLMIDRFAQTP